jgi:hypothetical protein
LFEREYLHDGHDDFIDVVTVIANREVPGGRGI